MGKVTGAMVSVLLIGGGTMGTLGGMLGSWAEPASVAVIGAGLWICSGLLGSRVRQPVPRMRVPREAS